jgi:site-specific DNA recombinase
VASAVYARISDDRQDGAGVGRQLADCRALVAARGWDPATEYVDNGVSASKYATKVRREYRRMLADVRSGAVDRIVVWAVDRLYRKTRELEDLIDLADAGQVEVVACQSGKLDLSSPDGRTMARVVVAFAAGETDKLSARTRRQQEQARLRGLPHGGRRALGWKDSTTPDPAEAAVILDAVSAIVDDGDSLATVARRWNAAGVRASNRPRGWNGTSVARTLTLPRHAGLIGHHGEVIGEASWPALIPRERWEQLRATLAARSAGKGLPRLRSLLTGLVRCGACGEVMVRSLTTGRTVWRCSRLPGRPAACGGVSIGADNLEAEVVADTLAYVDQADYAEVAAQHAGDDDVRALVAELAELERDARETADLAAARKIRPADFARYSSSVEAQQEALRARIGALTASSAMAPYAGKVGALAAAWGSLDVDRQRDITGESLKGITVAPSGRGRRFNPERIRYAEPRGKRARQRAA